MLFRSYDKDLLADYIYRNTPAYYNYADDPEHIIGRMLALGRASEITVWEFNRDFGGALGLDFRDSHRYQGKCRNDMPAVLYIQQLLFRAFRLPDDFWFANMWGDRLYTPSLDAVDKLLTGVTYDPITGDTFYDDATKPSEDGNAFVLVQGYQVGKDFFDRIRPDRFDLTQWNSVQNIWQKVEVQIQNNNDAQGQIGRAHV